jgi:hypothetical protein
VHLLVDSTGLKLCGAGEWLLEKHGTRTRRSWRKLHLGMDANTGQIVAAALTTNNVDDGAQQGNRVKEAAPILARNAESGSFAVPACCGTVRLVQRHQSASVPPCVREVVRRLEMISHFQRGGTEG